MIDRIKELMDLKKMTATQFAEEIGLQRSSLSHVLSGRNNPSLDFMLKIKSKFPEIRLDWLLLGEGEMTSSTHKKEELKVKELQEPAVSLTGQIYRGDKTKKLPDALTGSFESDEESSEDQEQKYIGLKKPQQIIILFSDNTFQVYRQ
jgi:transcriptional regulator with XRE-family HTH domain